MRDVRRVVYHIWAGESSQSTSDGRHKFEEPAFKQQPFGLHEQSNPLPLPWPCYGVQGVSSYCSQGIVSLRADEDTFYPCAAKLEGERHSISFYRLTSWYDGAACMVPLTFLDPDSCTSRQGGYLCAEHRPEEQCPHPGCQPHRHQSHLCCLSHRKQWDDKALESQTTAQRTALSCREICQFLKMFVKGYEEEKSSSRSPTPPKKLWSLLWRTYFLKTLSFKTSVNCIGHMAGLWLDVEPGTSIVEPTVTRTKDP